MSPEYFEMRPNQFHFRFFDHGQEFIIFSYGCFVLSANLLVGNMVLVQNVQWLSVESLLKGLHFSCAFLNFLSRSTVHRQKYGNDKGAPQLHI